MHAVPLLMFQGDAQEALLLWKRAFPDHLDVITVEHHDTGENKGHISSAQFRLGKSVWGIFDSPMPHAFTFTPSMSIATTCPNEASLRHAHRVLSENGKILVPLDQSEQYALFTWLTDVHGVSWQLMLPFPRLG